jgi:hypothetical protein
MTFKSVYCLQTPLNVDACLTPVKLLLVMLRNEAPDYGNREIVASVLALALCSLKL